MRALFLVKIISEALNLGIA